MGRSIGVFFSGDGSPNHSRVEAILRYLYQDVPGECFFSLLYERGIGYTVMGATWEMPLADSAQTVDLRTQVVVALRRMHVAVLH